MNKKTNGTCITTYSGIEYDILDPKEEDVNIIDIAHALAFSSRYNGHCKTFYSIAEHSVHISFLISKKYALWGLLHDATEAYVGDMVKPLKNVIPKFKEIENKNMEIICKKFNLQIEEPEEVKVSDYRMLLTEQKALFDKRNENLRHPVDAYEMKIDCWEPKIAELAFLGRFQQLINNERLSY